MNLTPEVPGTNTETHEHWYAPLTKVTPVSKVLALVLFIALPFIGFWFGVQYVANERTAQYASNTSAPTDHSAGSTTTEVQDVVPLTRTLLSRDELMAAEWNTNEAETLVTDQWKRFGEYEIKRTEPYGQITVRRLEEPHDVVAQYSSELFVPFKPDEMVTERQENISDVTYVVDAKTGKLYAFITFGNSHVGWLGRVYETAILEQTPKELENGTRWQTGGVKEWRFSPDHTSLSYLADETDAKLNESTGVLEQVGEDTIVFHIINLLNTERSVEFIVPHGDSRIGRSNVEYWIPAWRFIDINRIEFTLYRTKRGSHTQVSDKELWRYDRLSGKSTLLETVPWTQPHTSSSAAPVEEPIATSTYHTSSWHTYTNHALGFSIEYPADWQIKEEGDTVSFSYILPGFSGAWDDNIDGGREGRAYLQVSVRRDELHERTLEQWWHDSFDFLGGTPMRATIDGRPAVYALETEGVEAGSAVDYYVANGADVYTVSFSSHQNNYAQTYDAMLRSFHVISQATTEQQ